MALPIRSNLCWTTQRPVLNNWPGVANRIRSWHLYMKVSDSNSPTAGQILHLATLCRPRFTSNCAEVIAFISDLLRGPKRKLNFPEDMKHSFTFTKDAITKTALLVHPDQQAPVCLISDTSDTAFGAALCSTLTIPEKH